MGACEICGKKTTLLKAIVSGTELEVCEACSKFGKTVQKPDQKMSARYPAKIGSANSLYSHPKPKLEEPTATIVKDYSLKVKKAREKMNLSHEDLSKKIAERESMLHHIESGHHEPSIAVAKKLERFFNIKLIEELEEVNDATTELSKKKNTDGMTLGDFIKIKKK